MKTRGVQRALFVYLFLQVLGVSICFGEEAAGVTLSVEDAAICRGVVDRVPVEAGDVFPRGVKELYCFTRIKGADGETRVTHDWFYENRRVSHVVLEVKSSNWRTFSLKTISPEHTGQWKVEIRSEDGILLKQIYFAIH